MRESYLSRFTPSAMEASTLEALLVQRQDLVQQLVDRILESAPAKSKHHTLLVGPRGIGKTHLISTVYHRVNRTPQIPDRMCVAWLREEEWGVTSFSDLLVSILQALMREYKDESLSDRLKSLYDSSPRNVESISAKILEDYLAGRTLVLLVENLDELFKGLNEDGQMRLRAYIQEKSFFTILATTPSLFAGVSLQTSPFYGFFRVRHLNALTFEEALNLLSCIATLSGDADLSEFIKTPTGRARARAIHHIAGGNHRVYVVFSQFLTRKSLDELIEPFFRTLDDLTPYYQARMSYLSSQQQKIVATLCDFRRPMPVKEISQQCFITQQTASGQLKSLKQLGYVTSMSLGRESYYELREPLMSLVIEVKKHRVEPIRIFIDFLRLWYSRAELEKRLTSLHPEARYERQYVIHALETVEGNENTLIGACLSDCRLHISQGDYSSALQAAEELVAIRGEAEDYYEVGHCLGHMSRFTEAIEPLEKCLNIDPDHHKAWANKAGALLQLSRFEEALGAYEIAKDLNAANDLVWGGRGFALLKLGRYEEALASLNEAVRLDPKDHRHWANRALALADLGRQAESLESWNEVITLAPGTASAYLNRSLTLSELAKFDDALVDLQKAADLAGDGPLAWSVRYNKGLILQKAGFRIEAIKVLTDAIPHAQDHPTKLLDTGAALGRLDQEAQALKLYENALRSLPNDPHVWLHKAFSCLNLKLYEEALLACEMVVTLGDQSATAFFTRAETLIAMNDWEKAKPDIDTALGLRGNEDVTINDLRIVNLLFERPNQGNCVDRLADLTALYEKHDCLAMLGQALVANLKALTSQKVDKEWINRWCSQWKRLSEEHVELQMPVKLMDVFQRAIRNKDSRVLMEIPKELRLLLEPLIRSSDGDKALPSD